MKSLLLVTATLLCASTAMAAIPKKSTSTEFPKSVPLKNTQEALGLPIENRVQAVHAQGPQGYRNLTQIMFDEKASMDTRWRAVMAAGRVGNKNSVPELEKALRAKEWFMRNAGLIAISRVDEKKAQTWAEKLLSDKALVVRAAAVDVLHEHGQRSSADLLWKKLYSKENYKGKQSLFIRRRIAETLAKVGSKGDESRFIQVLGDKDEALHISAIAALERITQQTLGSANEPLKFKRAYWQKWWDDRASM